MSLKAWPAALFTSFILLMMIALVYSAQEWQFQARLFPLAIGIPTLALCLLQVGLDLMKGGRDEKVQVMDLPVDRSVPVPLVIRRATNVFAWILGLYAAIWLIGFVVSVPLFILLYLLIQAHEPWRIAVAYSFIMLVFLVGVFELVLHIPWPPGVFNGAQELLLSFVERYLSPFMPV